MTSLSTAKSLILITQNLNPDSAQLAHFLLGNDEALPADIKAGLSKTLLTFGPLEPFSRLEHIVLEIMVLSRPEYKRIDGVPKRRVACWDEIKAMGKKPAVVNAMTWFSMVCSIVLHDPENDLAPVLH